MTALISTAPTTGSPMTRLPVAPRPRTAVPVVPADDLREEAARHTRFWASYDAAPGSVTAWADAALSTWRRPAPAPRSPAREGLDQWDEEGGYDPA
ncbi:hypothetical protein [Rathayibacter sp. VKM Ac-2927]|uniref:hypothetical protein n=1 Tax=Rathayibacter sp. VKM Ac-2927 TaxID=2929478 RepID=UPI001FB2D89E|nr:hypothetical protein [Rathayibacter sp. VKM Ac-2927]MCJ1687458.1 hypothetical protein [Rathayibacter sp. VKM Ac-2927]